MSHLKNVLYAVVVVFVAACGAAQSEPPASADETTQTATLEPTGVLTAGFVGLETVYNSELMAPYDILQHSIFPIVRAGNE